MAGRRRAQRSGDPRVPAPSRTPRPASGLRRGPLLLTALVVGGLVAGVTGVSSASDVPTGPGTVLAAQMELATIGDDVEALPMALDHGGGGPGPAGRGGRLPRRAGRGGGGRRRGGP